MYVFFCVCYVVLFFGHGFCFVVPSVLRSSGHRPSDWHWPNFVQQLLQKDVAMRMSAAFVVHVFLPHLCVLDGISI